MRALRVVAELAEPVVYYGDGMHLDGPLQYAAFRELPALTRHRMPMMDEAEWVQDFDIPVARHRVLPGRLGWTWCCSAVHADWKIHTTVQTRKRPAMRQMVRYTKDKSINVASGAVKAWNLKYPARWAPALVWYVLGEERRLVYLLETHVTHLGKKSRHGNGRVLRWRVEPFEQDWSVRRGALLTRRLPATDDDKTGLVRAGVRAPYHHHSRQALCVEPNFEELKPCES